VVTGAASGLGRAILERLADRRARGPWAGLAFGPGLVGEMVVIGAA
jgi:hypothetical protein